jgi:hypothetical protein
MISRLRGLRGLVLLLLVALVLAGATGGNAADDPPGGEAEGDSTLAEGDSAGTAGAGPGGDLEPGQTPADTTAEASQAARRSGRRFSPTYSSGYEVNRSTSNWSQGFTFNSWVGPVDFTTATSVAIGKDNSLDRDRWARTANIGIAYNVRNGPRIGSRIAVIRNQTVDAGVVRNSQDSDRFDINTSYARTLFSGIGGAFTAAAGTSRAHQDDPLTSSRRSNGPHADASATFTLKRGADWSLRTGVRNSHLKSTADQTGVSTSDNNFGGDLDFKVDFKVPGFDQWSVTAGNRLTRNQYPLVRTIPVPGETDSTITLTLQETNATRNRDVSVNASATPLRRLNLAGSVSYRNNNINRDIDVERSQQSIDRDANWKLTYLFPDSTQTEFRQELTLAKSLYEAETRRFLNGDIRSRSVGGSARRPVGRRADADVSVNYQLQSFLFENVEDNADDRDLVHVDLTTGFNYRPYGKITSTVRFTFQHNQTIFVDASKSGTNQTQQSYSINPTLEYRLNPRITFREEASAIANATIIDFNEDENRLSRSTELRSIIDTRPLSRLGFGLRHSLRFLESGSYRRREDGVRVFGKANDETSHDLTFRADYTPVSGVNAHFRTNKRVSDRITLTSRGGRVIETLNTSEFTEIEVGARINRTLRNELQIAVDLKRHQTWTSVTTSRNNYMVGSLSISKRF